MKNKKTIIFSITLALLLYISLDFYPLMENFKACENLNFINRNMCRISNNLSGFGYGAVITTTAISFLIYKLKQNLNKISQKRKISSIITSAIFSIFIVIGKAYTKSGTITSIYSSIYNILMCILVFITFVLFFNLIVLHIYSFFDNYKFKQNNKIKQCAFSNFLNKKPFLTCFIMTMIVSTIYLIFFYPGVIAYDGLWQLDFYYDIIPFSNHHPAALTIFMGKLMEISRHFNLPDNTGIFFYVFIQMLLNALIYSYTIKIMSKMKAPKWLMLSTSFFYSCFPLLAIYSVTYIKDTLYYLIFLLIFVYQYYHFYILKEQKILNYIILAILYIILYLLRNTGFYIAILTLIPIALMNIKQNKKATIKTGLIIISIICLNYSYNNFFLKANNILEAPKREMLSVPIQQSARYIKNNLEKITEEERESLEKIFIVKLEKLPKLYDPNRSDAMKWKFKKYPTSEELNEYFNVWFKMFFKNPIVYFDATIHNTYGYFYPDVKNFIHEELGFYDIAGSKTVNTGFFDLHFNEKTESGRKLIKYIAEIFIDIPIIGMLYCCSTYTWFVILITIYLLSKKKIKMITYYMPLYVTILMCLVSPVNGHMRYLQPILVCAPFVISTLLYEINDKSTKNVKKQS